MTVPRAHRHTLRRACQKWGPHQAELEGQGPGCFGQPGLREGTSACCFALGWERTLPPLQSGAAPRSSACRMLRRGLCAQPSGTPRWGALQAGGLFPIAMTQRTRETRLLMI